MRFPRVKAEGQGFYHCVSRVVEGRFIFQTSGHGSAEAERFVHLMRRLEAFSPSFATQCKFCQFFGFFGPGGPHKHKKAVSKERVVKTYPLHGFGILSKICRRHVFAQYDPDERRQEALLLVNRGKSALPSYTSREGSAGLPAVGRFLGQSRDRDAHAASVLGPDHTEEFRLQDRHQFGSWQSRTPRSPEIDDNNLSSTCRESLHFRGSGVGREV
jgi:hypothetical protein